MYHFDLLMGVGDKVSFSFNSYADAIRAWREVYGLTSYIYLSEVYQK